MLERFSCTQSVGQSANNMGCDVVSLGTDFNTKPDLWLTYFARTIKPINRAKLTSYGRVRLAQNTA